MRALVEDFDRLGNDITKEGAFQIADALSSNTSLRTIYLDGKFLSERIFQIVDNPLGDSGVSSLARALINHPCLEELWLKCSRN